MSSPPLFRFEKTSVIAIGAFNARIIHPTWLVEIGAMDAKESEMHRMEINVEEATLRLAPVSDATDTWTISTRLLAVESTQEDTTIWDAVGKVLKKLPWTPLTAVGTNFHFKSTDHPPSPHAPLIPSKLSVQGYQTKVMGSMIGLTKADSESVRNVQTVMEGDSCSVVVNFHTDMKPHRPPGDQAKAIEEALGNFPDRKKEADKLIDQLFRKDGQ
ncbi:hypothetical protein Enr13x_04950 [Stieleria neptunia]|uniref:Uncharacterized protein n=2 Tax=Stieleria neptunia TaxID=2527979 RepID=A0A518HII5_9BACT|nr:hypothetical protein Enr13x_04950 [Stieleria neptunia]